MRICYLKGNTIPGEKKPRGPLNITELCCDDQGEESMGTQRLSKDTSSATESMNAANNMIAEESGSNNGEESLLSLKIRSSIPKQPGPGHAWPPFVIYSI